MKELLKTNNINAITIEPFEMASFTGMKLFDFIESEEGEEYQYKLTYNVNTKLYVLAKTNMCTGHKDIVTDTSYIDVLCRLKEKSLLKKYNEALSKKVAGLLG